MERMYGAYVSILFLNSKISHYDTGLSSQVLPQASCEFRFTEFLPACQCPLLTDELLEKDFIFCISQLHHQAHKQEKKNHL